MPNCCAFDPEIMIRTADEEPVRVFRSLGQSIASAEFRAEVRQYEWERATDACGWSDDCAQLLMFARRRISTTSAYLVRGEGRTHAQDLGDVMLVPRGTRLYSRCPPGEMRALWCFFDPALVSDFASIEWSEARLPELLDIRSASVQSGMARIAKEVLSPGLASQAMVEGTFLVLLSELCRGFSAGKADQGSSRLTSRQMRMIAEAIEGERRAPTLDELAALCGLSRRHLVRTFRNTTGRTIGEHILEMRIHRARSLLQRRDLLVKQVAFQCGFSSSAAFATAFRRATGQGPREFQNHVAAVH